MTSAATDSFVIASTAAAEANAKLMEAKANAPTKPKRDTDWASIVFALLISAFELTIPHRTSTEDTSVFTTMFGVMFCIFLRFFMAKTLQQIGGRRAEAAFWILTLAQLSVANWLSKYATPVRG